MRSPAAAIAWEFYHRQRWGLAALALYFVILAAIRIFISEPGQHFTEDNPWGVAFVTALPTSASIAYFLAVFSFGLSGDVAARESMFPARMFTLPVTSAQLALWPMLYGTAAMAVLWLAIRLLAIWPAAFNVPVAWPALFGAVLLAWIQALTWMPYALRGLRVLVAILWLTMIAFGYSLAIHFKAPEHVMLALLAPHLPLAYLIARRAVARARCSDLPDWRDTLTRLGRIADLLPVRRGHFPSPASAQVWFEWRRHGRSLPLLVGILLPFQLALVFLFNHVPHLVMEVLIAVLLTAPFMAMFVAATVRKSSRDGSDSYELSTFVATRPMSSVALVSAKIQVTIWSTLAAWALVLSATPLALYLSDCWGLVTDLARQLVDVVGTARAITIGMLGLVALVTTTWKQLVQSLYVGLSGRAWLVKGSAFLALALLFVVVPVGKWVIGTSEVLVALWDALPWILTVLVCVKMVAATWIVIRLRDTRLLSGRTLIAGATCWATVVVALLGLLVWLVPTTLLKGHVLALVAILAVPLARLSAAPLALSWNRHR